MALGLHYRQPTYKNARASVAVEHFEQAVTRNPAHLTARLNLADALFACGNGKAAIEQCRQGLTWLERHTELDPATLDGGQFHTTFDNFRNLWEVAAWSNAGNSQGEIGAKKDLLRWRFHLLLFKLTQDLVHEFKAYLMQQTLPNSVGGLGVALATKQYHLEALAPLRQAVADNPLDRDAVRALHHVLQKIEDREALEKLIEDRRLLAQAAPGIVPPEPWFCERKPSGKELASIIVLCCNQLEFTKQCLESVLKHTRAPYELIVVDNASSDGTAAYLKEFRSRTGPVRLDVIRNETNVGFPADQVPGQVREPDPPKGGTWQEEGIDEWLAALRWVMEENQRCDRTEWQRTARRLKKRDESEFVKQLRDAESQWRAIKAKRAETAAKEEESDPGTEMSLAKIEELLKSRPWEREEEDE